MVDFSSKRLQIFVSSTYTDLKEERQAVVQAILSLKHIPAGMELFTAGDQSQLDTIKEWIDESDVFILIIGGRYGSIEPLSGKSYTQLEYEYAVERKKPHFVLILTPGGIKDKVSALNTDAIETDNPQMYKDFVQAFKDGLMCAFWNNIPELKVKTYEALAGLSGRENLGGWVKARDQDDAKEAYREVARLSQENRELRARLNSSEETIRIAGLTYKEMDALLIKKRLIQYFDHAALLSELVKGSHNIARENDYTALASYGLVERIAETLTTNSIVAGGGVNHRINIYYRLTAAGQAFSARRAFERIS